MRLPIVLASAVLLAACGAGGDTAASSTTSTTTKQGCAHVIDATATQSEDGSWTFSATVSSADTGWEKYADQWEVRSPDGSVLGTRVLAHPHEAEQPFTRSLTGVIVPDGTDRVVVAARDSVEGHCGETFELSL